MRSSLLRFLALLLLLLGAAGRTQPLAAAEDPPCPCGTSLGACQHFLRNPAGPPDDPCWCERCATNLQGRRHDGAQPIPGWSPECFKSTRMACYLRRHAAVWQIACSECMADKPCCPAKNHENCPDCDETTKGPPVGKDFLARDAKATVRERLEKERKLFKEPKEVMVLYNRHFYFVTDVEGFKLKMPMGPPRFATGHEWAHLMIERAEYCRREWVRKFGEPPRVDLPMGMYFTAKEKDKEKIAGTYLNSARATGLLGNASRPADGMCITAMAFSSERVGQDRNLHVEMRHQMTHCLFSCWGHHETRPSSLPPWAHEGLAHWLTRFTPNLADDAAYCAPEGAGPGEDPHWPAKEWEEDLVKLVTANKLEPIEKLMGKLVKGELNEIDNKRAWSLVSLCLSDLGKPFIELLGDVRKERELNEAFKARLGMTPDELDRRWRERILGKRASLGGEAPKAVAGDDPAARGRDAIAGEQDLGALASKIRQLGTIADPGVAEVVTDQLARKSDLVREMAFVTLLKMTDKACRERAVARGLAHDSPVVRAYSARLAARFEQKSALPALEKQLGDSHWFPRAEAAVALGKMKHGAALARLREIIASDPSEKAQVAAMDAVASFGNDARTFVPVVAKHLSDTQWQIRVAAAQSLGAIGSMEGVEPLVARMEIESGRVRDEIRASLKEIARDDLGAQPEHWRTWWDREKGKSPGSVPPRPDAPPAGARPRSESDTHSVSEAKYYGMDLVSNRIAFVVDTSGSMGLLFEPDAAAAKVLSRAYKGGDKITICREEVAQTLRTMQPTAHIQIVTFGTAIKAFRPRPVPATPGNVKEAIEFLASVPPDGETNYYDAFRTALDMGDDIDLSSDFRTTPDTITFLTDGQPTAGEVTDPDCLVEWYTGLNRYARVKTFTVTFGLNRVDTVLLRRLAEQNGGRFTLVPEKPQ